MSNNRSSVAAGIAAAPKRQRDATLLAAIDHVAGRSELPGLTTHQVGDAQLVLVDGSAETRQFNEIQGILKEYSSRKPDSRPLSLAVFGPPGSGKSRWVRAMIGSARAFELVEINLAQVQGPEGLAASIHAGIESPAKPGETETDKPKMAEAGTAPKPTKAFFFDEFDCTLNDEPLGWLRWFLGLMQDGKFFRQKEPLRIGRAVLIFAGGTAESLRDFEERAQLDPVAYKNRKVPDFISRLRGFVDIQGINEGADKVARRAVILKDLLKQERFTGKTIADDLVESLLDNVHFVHGVRSMEALLDMCRIGNSPELTRNDLPSDELRKLHINRGPLDGKTIGISAWFDTVPGGGLLHELSMTLLHSGATLAYGGDFWPKGTLEGLVDAADSLPNDLVEGSDTGSKKRVRNYLGFPSFHRGQVRAQIHAWEGIDELEVHELWTLTSQECQHLGVPENDWFEARPEPPSTDYSPNRHLAWAISLFRMRVRMIHDVDALIVLGGKDGDSWGRFPGIAEEAMLAIAMSKPIYVLGGSPPASGGAARELGRLLGLGEVIANPDTCFKDVDPIIGTPLDGKYANSFAIPGHPDLPRTISALRTYLFERPPGSSGWPWNGLTPRQNRALFCLDTTAPSPATGGIVDLVLKGLSRLTWKDH